MRCASLLVSAVLSGGFVLASAACGEPAPDRIELVPPGPFKFEDSGQSTRVGIEAFRGRLPWQGKETLQPSFSSSNSAVATIDATGNILSVGSGTATVTATLGKLRATGDVKVSIVSAIEVAAGMPKVFRFNGAPYQLSVVVKDERGNVVDGPKVRYRASDYCVDVSPQGLVSPLALGSCEVVIESAARSVRIPVEVR